MPLVFLLLDLVLHISLLGACRKCSFITAITLQMAMIKTAGIFRPISISF